MSEFSESVLVRGDAVSGEALLRRAGRAGWVLPGAGAWTTVVVDAPFRGEVDPAVRDAVEGVAVSWVFPEDHGWELELIVDGVSAAMSRAEWDDDEVLACTGLAPADVAAHLGVPVEEVAGVWIEGEGPADEAALARLADRMGWTDVAWTSGAYLASGDHPALGRPDLIRVEAP